MDKQSQGDAMDALFAEDGHHLDARPARQQPEKALEPAQFFEALQACIDRLPAKAGRLFMLREWLNRQVEDICGERASPATAAA